jgi:hypothetical protein
VTKVGVVVELEDGHYRSLVSEAKRRGVSVESLVEAMTQQLITELEEEERAGTDHPISTS